MVDRLSVASDELQLDGMAFHCCPNGFGVGLSQSPVESREFCGGSGFGIHRRQDGLAQSGCEREGLVRR